MFTKEHYDAIARALKDTITEANNRFDYVGTHISRKVVNNLVSLFESDNKMFDTKKFLDIIYRKEGKHEKR